MPLYKFRAINQRGRVQSGQLTAISPLDLQHQLIQAGMTLVESHVLPPPKTTGLKRKPTLRDLAQLCHHLAQLDRSGVQLVDNLRDVADATPNMSLKAGLFDVALDVEQGQPLSRALMARPGLFPRVMVALVSAGEASSQLTEGFEQLSTHFRWQDKFQSRLRQAALYPLLSFGVMMAVIIFLMAYVIPDMGDFLRSIHNELPIETEIFLTFASVISAAWLPLLAGGLLAFLLMSAAYKKNGNFAYRVDYYLLRMPLVRKSQLAKFAQTFATLFQSGIGLSAALETASRAVSNKALAESLSIMQEQVQNGSALSRAARLSGEFPNMVLRMMQIGEESGKLALSLAQAADYYEDDVKNAAENLIAALGPLITTLTGCILILLILSIFLPIYDALPQLI